MSRPNVLLLVMDSVRAKNSSLYGHHRETTPFLEEFAESATVYEQARAPGRWSLPSHTSIFTGLHVAEHGLCDEGLRLETGTIFSELADEHGYDTGLFSYNGYINGRVDTGLSDGFNTVEGYRDPLFPNAANPAGLRGQKMAFLRQCLASGQPVRSVLNGLLMKAGWDYPELTPDWFLRNTSAGQTPDDVYVNLFLDWHADRDGPWAACLNFMETHNDYLPAPEHSRWEADGARALQAELENGSWEYLCGGRPLTELELIETLYDGAIHQVDNHVRRVVESLDRQGVLEDTLVVITADHGEGFGEPCELRDGLPMVQHVVGANECLLHVPLVVQFPGQSDGVTVSDVASLTKFPTVVRAAVEGRATPEAAFVPGDGWVLASTHGLNEVNDEKMRRYCDDETPFHGDTLVVYRGAAPRVEKATIWEDRSVTLEIKDAQTARVVKADRREDVVATFEGLECRDIISENRGVSNEVEQQLKHLGYR